MLFDKSRLNAERGLPPPSLPSPPACLYMVLLFVYSLNPSQSVIAPTGVLSLPQEWGDKAFDSSLALRAAYAGAAVHREGRRAD